MMMKTLVLPLLLVCASQAQAEPFPGLKVPLRWGVYVADVEIGRVRSMGDFYDWSLSPDGRFCVGGRHVESKKTSYEVSVVSTSSGMARRLERFPGSEEEETYSAFKWSPDSSRVSVSTDRNGDGKDEIKTFDIARPHPLDLPRTRARRLSPVALRRLKARFQDVSDVTFSPGGSRVVAYLSRSSHNKPDFDGGLGMFAPDGTLLQRLTRNAPMSRRDLETGNPPQSRDLQDREPRWLPDGQHLAFRRGSSEEET